VEKTVRGHYPRVSFFGRKKSGYQAAIHVEQYRARAEQLRDEEPDLYKQILSQADGTDGEDAARRNPVEYVALFLKAADEVEAERGG
jgi:hypothetical protein